MHYFTSQPDDDEDEDLDDIGPIPTEEELEQINEKIQHFNDVDPVSAYSLEWNTNDSCIITFYIITCRV